MTIKFQCWWDGVDSVDSVMDINVGDRRALRRFSDDLVMKGAEDASRWADEAVDDWIDRISEDATRAQS